LETGHFVACQKSRARAGTALVVDDDPPIRSLLRTVLTRHGFEVIEAHDGLHALSWLEKKEGHQCVDVLITDVVMPGSVNGVTVAETFLRECPFTRVVLISGYSDASSINLESNGRWLFVPKPFLPRSLVQAIQELGVSRSQPSGAKPDNTDGSVPAQSGVSAD
jgi:two-component system, cell cycle sensor histidine kinase and response regulator CckA